jgi:hypothetical protein
LTGRDHDQPVTDFNGPWSAKPKRASGGDLIIQLSDGQIQVKFIDCLPREEFHRLLADGKVDPLKGRFLVLPKAFVEVGSILAALVHRDVRIR